MELMDVLRQLEFSQEWVDLGIITPAKLKQIEVEWLIGEDTNPEHYRWQAFLNFMQMYEILDEHTAWKLYSLGANDPDSAMGGSMMATILRRKDCPKDLLESAAKSEEKYLRKIANERLVAG